MFEQYEIEPNIAVARFLRLFDVQAPDGFKREKHEGGVKALQALERGLAGREFLVADSYSVADISLYAYVHVADEGGFDLAPFPAVRAWVSRVATQPGHVLITDGQPPLGAGIIEP